MGLLDYIKGFEGYAPKAQWDYKQNSVGWGTRAKYPGEVIDKDEAERRLQSEIDNARSIVDRHAPNIDPGTKAALTSLTYNAGDTWTRSGLGAAVQAGDPNAIRERFLQYTKAGGQTLPGLVKRRQQEAQWIGNTEVFDERQRTPTGGSVSDTATGLGGYGPIAADTRMALGGPPQPATPQPNGAPQMAEQKQGGFGGLLSAFANGMQSPLFMSGAAMYNAGAEGRNVGGGFLAGGQAASEATKNQFMQDKLRREQDIEQRQQQMWDQVTSGQTPEWASGLPQNTLQLARALGPVAGPKLISEMVVKQASANSYGKQGTIVQGGDGRFYSIQFSENGQRKIEPLEIGQQGAMPGVPGAPQPGVTGQPVPPVAGQQPQAPVSLSPSRGVDVVGSKIIDKATGRPVRDAGPDLADRKTQEEVGEAKGKFIAALPKLQMAQTALAAKNELVKEEIDRALKEVNWSTTGIVGAMSRGIPGTPGFKLNQLIQTIKANIGFDQLNNMRAESPTGGALGAIAVQELTYLQSVLGSLEQAQDGETITLNLNRLKKAMDGAAERRAAALQMDLQRFGTGGGQPAAPAAGGSWGIRKLGQ